MKKNQKYTQEEMFLAIELWRESKLSQEQFCQRENISISTFQYWLKKQRDINVPKQEPKKKKQSKETFIPVQVNEHLVESIEHHLEITYPNGVKLTCPANMEINQIKTLIQL